MCVIALETHSYTLGGVKQSNVAALPLSILKNDKILLRKSQNLTEISKYSKTWKLRRHVKLFYTKATKMCYNWLLGGLDWPLALTALGMDWTEDDTVKTTVNGISNITFIEL